MQKEFPCACAAIRQLSRVVTSLYDGQLRSAGLEAPQFALLMTLDRQGPCSQAELGRRYALDKTTVSRNLKVLQEKRWIEPAPSPETDHRQRRFTLTAAGRKTLAKATPAWKKAQSELRSHMSSRQWEEMFRVFKTIAAAAIRS